MQRAAAAARLHQQIALRRLVVAITNIQNLAHLNGQPGHKLMVPVEMQII